MTEIDELRAEVLALRATVEELRRTALAGSAAPAPTSDPSATVSRRTAFRALGAAAVGAAAGSIAFAAPAGAVDGGNVQIGNETQTAESPTVLRVADGTTWVNNANRFGGLGVTDVATADLTGGNTRAAVFGWTDGSVFSTGVVGTAYTAGVLGAAAPTLYGGEFSGFDAGVVASSDNYGVIASGYFGSLKLGPQYDPVTPSLGDAGVVRYQLDDGGLYFSVTGTGTDRWRRLTGENVAGAFTAITPARVYDSRWGTVGGVTTGVLASGATREVSVADGRGPTGAVTTADAVPAGARAIAYNLTITGTTGGGFLAVSPGGVSTGASTINWSATGIDLANAAIVGISTTRTVRVAAGGPGSTNFIIDVSGFWL